MNLGTIDIGVSMIACLIYFIQSCIALEKSQPLNMKIMVFINPLMILILVCSIQRLSRSIGLLVLYC